jgi:hypothetical protein
VGIRKENKKERKKKEKTSTLLGEISKGER